jgi:hypothetical protein
LKRNRLSSPILRERRANSSMPRPARERDA